MIFFSVNVFELFTKVQQRGGFDTVTRRKLWKHVYEEIVGAIAASNSAQPSITNAGVMKRHYERLVYEYIEFLSILKEQKVIT